MSKKITFNKNRYRQLCRSSKILPIFFQDWWLDLVCGESHWKVMLYEEDPHIVAVMAWYEKTKGPFHYITMPPLTKFSGPYFLRDFSDRKKQSILVKMVEALPSVSSHQQTFHYQIDNWLPFKWVGFKQTVYYSYMIPDISDLDAVWHGISSDYRNQKIRRVQDLLTCGTGLSTQELIPLFRQPFIRQGITMPIADGLLREIIEVVQSRGAGTSIYTRDRTGKVQAGVFLLWDNLSTYLFLTGEYDDFRSVGAGIFTLWKAIEYASNHRESPQFDFLGGMSENLERTRRQFGAKQKTYFYLWRRKWFFAFLQDLFK